MKARLTWLAVAALGASGCIGFTVQKAPPELPGPPVPDKYTGDTAPALIDAGLGDCKQAKDLDPNLYYCGGKDEHWYRWTMNRWYLAFAWNGNWFPVTGSELPKPLASVTPTKEQVVKSREEKLKELEEKLEKLDQPEKKPPERAD
jgi:hypothetical protein